MAKTKRIHYMTILQWEAAFPTEEACAAYLVAHRWPDGVHRPRCGAVEPHDLGDFRRQCYWSLIKRSIVGSFHKVSETYPPLYVAEAQFKYNNCENADIFGTATHGC